MTSRLRTVRPVSPSFLDEMLDDASDATAKCVGSVPLRAEVEFQRQQLHSTIWAELADDGVRANEMACRDENAIVASARQQLGEVFKASSEALDDLEEFERLEVPRRGFSVGSALTAKLPIQVLEE